MRDMNNKLIRITNEVSNIIVDNLFKIEHEIEASGRKEELIGLQRMAVDVNSQMFRNQVENRTTYDKKIISVIQSSLESPLIYRNSHSY